MAAACIRRVVALLERAVPPGVSSEVRRRSLTVASFTVIVVVAIVICLPLDIAHGDWAAVGVMLGGGSLAFAMLPVLRRGYLRFTAHFNAGLFVFGLMAVAASKGGVIAPEISWLAAAVVFSVLVLGPRGAFVWTVVACIGIAAFAATSDPEPEGVVVPALDDPLAFAVDQSVLLFVTLGLAVAFHATGRDYLARLAASNEEMQRVLQHSRDGLLTIDRTGRVSTERSARADVLLGSISEGALLWDVIAREDPRTAGALQVGWEAVLEDVLPRELALAQLPKRVSVQGRTLDVQLTVIEQGGVIGGALVVLHDVTDELSRERAERANRDLLEVFKHARVDAPGVVGFVREMDRLASSVAHAADATSVLRGIHTMKGNAGMFGVRVIADLCHEIEQRAAEESGVPSPADRTRLAAAWAEVSHELGEWVDAERGQARIDVGPQDLADLQRAIEARVPHAELARRVAGWHLAPMSRLLARMGRQADALAYRLGKRVKVQIEPTDARVDADVLAPVLSALVHVVRNAIDHGIEPEEERLARGKPPVGTLRISAKLARDTLDLDIVDDGRGVDWELVRQKAVAAGLSPDVPNEALFADGFSTRDAATDVSGRGVGLGAVRAVVRSFAGDAAFDAELGHGSTFCVSIPVAYATGRIGRDFRPRMVS